MLFVAIDPIGVVAIFVSLTASIPASARRRVALKGTGVATLVLVLFALVGETVLASLGIGMPAFRIAGGLLLLLIAGEMLFERRNQRRSRSAEAIQTGDDDDVAVFPLAVPLLAGPGAMTAVVLLMNDAQGSLPAQATVLATLLVVMGLSLAMMLLAAAASRHIGRRVVDVITRLLGVLLAALAVQFIIDGVRRAFDLAGG